MPSSIPCLSLPYEDTNAGSCCGRSSHGGRWKHGSPTCRRVYLPMPLRRQKGNFEAMATFAPTSRWRSAPAEDARMTHDGQRREQIFCHPPHPATVSYAASSAEPPAMLTALVVQSRDPTNVSRRMRGRPRLRGRRSPPRRRLVVLFRDRRASAHVSDALLGSFLGWRFWLCRKLKHRCLLTLA